MRTLKRPSISAIAACETFGVVILVAVYVCYVYNIQVMHGDVRGVCVGGGRLVKERKSRSGRL